MIKNSPKMGHIGLSMAQMVKANSTNIPTCGCGQGPRGWGTCGCVAGSEAAQWGAPTHTFPFLTPRARPGRPSRQGSASRGFAPGFRRRDLEPRSFVRAGAFSRFYEALPPFLPSPPWGARGGLLLLFPSRRPSLTQR